MRDLVKFYMGSNEKNLIFQNLVILRKFWKGIIILFSLTSLVIENIYSNLQEISWKTLGFGYIVIFSLNYVQQTQKNTRSLSVI